MTGKANGPSPPRLAALDLGSNSFHLLVAEHDGRAWQPLQRVGEKVQLAAGMRDGELHVDAIARGLDCLNRFLPDFHELPRQCVRIVGTQALRMARNADAFLHPAEALLQRPVEVISGEEEARLIYSAVAAERPSQPLLVVDVGGGSTELICGTNEAIRQLRSVPIGCVCFIAEHFPAGKLDGESLRRARSAAKAAFASAWSLDTTGFEAVGCSGTMLAIGEVLHCNGWGSGGIDRAGLAVLEREVATFDSLDAVRFEGLCESRRSVFACGVAIVQGLFDALCLEHVDLSGAALREGVIAELASRQAIVTADCL